MASPRQANKKGREFDPNTFLATIGEGRKNLTFAKKQGIFAQGDPADAVFYIQKGKVKLTVVSTTGREATIGILGEGDFFGEGMLAGQALRMGSAAAMTDCEIQRIDKKAMVSALHREHAFSDLFVAYLLARNVRYAGSSPASARSFWQGWRARDGDPKNQSGESGRNGRDDSFARELFHEPVQETGFCRLLRRSGRRVAGPQLAAWCRSARLSCSRQRDFATIFCNNLRS